MSEKPTRHSKMSRELSAGKPNQPKYEGPTFDEIMARVPQKPDTSVLDELVDIDWSAVDNPAPAPETEQPKPGRMSRLFGKARRVLDSLSGANEEGGKREQRRRIIGVVVGGVALASLAVGLNLDAQPAPEKSVAPTHQVTNYELLRNSGATDAQATSIVENPQDFEQFAEWDTQYRQDHPGVSQEDEVAAFEAYVHNGQS